MANLAHSTVELSEFQIGYIFGATEFGATQATIADKVGCGQNTVSRILHRYDAETFTTRHKRSGPQRKTDKCDDRRIVYDAIQHRRQSLEDITTNSRLNISKNTVGRRLHEHGLYSHVAVQKPWLDDEHRKV